MSLMSDVDILDLIEYLRNGKTSADRMAAADALAASGPASLPPLVEALGADDPRLRMWAAYALGMLGDERAVPALTLALDDDDPDVVKWAAASLDWIRDMVGGCGSCRFC